MHSPALPRHCLGSLCAGQDVCHRVWWRRHVGCGVGHVGRELHRGEWAHGLCHVAAGWALLRGTHCEAFQAGRRDLQRAVRQNDISAWQGSGRLGVPLERKLEEWPCAPFVVWCPILLPPVPFKKSAEEAGGVPSPKHQRSAGWRGAHSCCLASSRGVPCGIAYGCTCPGSRRWPPAASCREPEGAKDGRATALNFRCKAGLCRWQTRSRGGGEQAHKGVICVIYCPLPAAPYCRLSPVTPPTCPSPS